MNIVPAALMASSTYRFGEFRLDPARRELCRGDEELPLPPKAFGCLVYLVDNRDRAVGRDELIDAVWSKENLADSVLGQAIVDVRRALGDNGEGHQYIQTVRGFGYRWAAPVEIAATATNETSRSRRRRLWLLLAIPVAALLIAGTIHLWRRDPPRGASEQVVSVAEGGVALLLPVTVEAGDHHPWIRLGVMDLIAARLRAAGQTMVPSDTVIALLRDHSVEPNPQEINGLVTASGAHHVLGARAETAGDGWRVSLRSLRGASPPLTALGEAEDVLDAARLAADRMALSLGLVPAPEPDTEPGLATLLQQAEAAMLAQQMDVARDLIETADAELRQHPEVRFQAARIEYFRHRLDAAQAALESLLEDVPEERDRELRARVLGGLGIIHFQRTEPDAAEPLLEEAIHLLGPADDPSVLGRIRNTLGIVALMRDDFAAAREHLAQARVAYEGAGDLRGWAGLLNNFGVLEVSRERYAEAIPYLESAADHFAALNDLDAELRTRKTLIHLHLYLLQPQAASALEPRVNELLAQVDNPQTVNSAVLAKAHLMAANGHRRAAEELVTEVLTTSETDAALYSQRLLALMLRAEWALGDGELARAARLAEEVVRELPGNYAMIDDDRGRAWRILIRARLARGDLAGAAESTTAMAAWAAGRQALSPKISASLAHAELAAARGASEAAEAAFERARSLADSSRVPLRVLEVADSYVRWLLTKKPRGGEDVERAIVVMDQVAGHASRDYAAALLQLRAYHAGGSTAAWRAALDRAQSLAGERQIPPELLVTPRITAPKSNDRPEITLG